MQAKSKGCFLLFILLIYLAVQRLIEALGKLLIDPIANINIFIFIFYNSYEQKIKARQGPDYAGLWTKLKRSFLLFILFIYLVIQRLIEELGKLSIDSLTKINIYSMFHRNKKERFGKVLTGLSCGK